MSSSNLSSSAASSPNRVRFSAEPTSPSPKRRSRRMSLPYPGVAQGSKGSDRNSFDLYWKLQRLSAASDVVPVDASESGNETRPIEDTKTDDHAPAKMQVTPTKTRSHNYLVLSRKQQEALSSRIYVIEGDK